MFSIQIDHVDGVGVDARLQWVVLQRNDQFYRLTLPLDYDVVDNQTEQSFENYKVEELEYACSQECDENWLPVELSMNVKLIATLQRNEYGNVRLIQQATMAEGFSLAGYWFVNKI